MNSLVNNRTLCDTIFLLLMHLKAWTFSMQFNRSSNNSQRHKSIKHPHNREIACQSGRLWVCTIRLKRQWWNSHFNSSQRNSWILRSWIPQDKSTHWQEWCLLLWRRTCRTGDWKKTHWTEETAQWAHNNKMGKHSYILVHRHKPGNLLKWPHL